VKKKKPGKPKPDRTGAKGENVIPFAQVQEVLDFMDERGLEEFEVERAGFHIRLKRRPTGATPPVVFANANPAAAGPNHPGAAPAVPAELPPEAEFRGEDVRIVKSPIVGTFYAAPRPDAPPFVKLGDSVEAGQVLCIIEAMKLMNEIESDVAGEIVRIYVENAQAVEYGEPLFAIRPLKKK
jgi:acetyl-CoA carboxylase biotin carboxyl carrier protein